MTLQNRVTPDAQLVAEPWRGMFMGNRGGRIHDPETKTLLKRKWASKRWIICRTDFKKRQRTVMGNSYTELFFLDEVSALTAGHRPCFECRRTDAKTFSMCWEKRFGKYKGSLADSMDKQLHEERTSKPEIITTDTLSTLPNGTMIKVGEDCFAIREGYYLLWSGKGYQQKPLPKKIITLLTPRSIVAILKAGYEPTWHESAS